MLLHLTGMPSWILPSVHRMPESYRLPRSIMDVADSVSKIVFERDLDALFGVTRDGPKVIDTLSPNDLRAAESVWTGPPFEADVSMLHNLSVAQAAQEIDIAVSRYLGNAYSEHGVDPQLWSAVPASKRAWFQSINELEHALSVYPVEEQLAELRYTCDISTSCGDAAGLLAAWDEANVERLAEYTNKMYERTPVHADSMLRQRNVRMLDLIQKDIAAQVSALYVVGAAHVFGRHGLESSLRESGINLEIRST